MRRHRHALVVTSVLALALTGLAPAAAGTTSPALVPAAASAAAPAELPVPLITAVNGVTRHRVNWYTPDPSGQIVWTVPEDARITGFDVLVDDVVVSQHPADARTATLTYAEGWNRVVVRAHVGDATTDSVHRRVFLDTVVPRFVHPTRIELSSGPVTTSKVPMAFRWKVEENNYIHSGMLRRGDWYTAVPRWWERGEPITGGIYGFTSPPGTHTWRAELDDPVGNRAEQSWTRGVEVRGERLASHEGAWAPVTNSRYTHGTAMRSTTPGAELTLTTTARSIGWTAYAPGDGTWGIVKVYVDGRLDEVTDVLRPRGSNVVWNKTWPYPGKHTVRVVVADPRPYGPTTTSVTSDGFTIIR